MLLPNICGETLRWAGSGSPSLQHSDNSKVFIEVGPVDAHRHDIEIGALLWRGALEARVPVERRRDLPAVDQRYHELGRGELDRTWPQVADINLQSAHSRTPPARCDAISETRRLLIPATARGRSFPRRASASTQAPR